MKQNAINTMKMMMIIGLMMMAWILFPAVSYAAGPTIRCGDVVEGDGQLELPVQIDIGELKADTVQVDMRFDEATLSNPVVQIGSDFSMQWVSEVNGDNLFIMFSQNGGNFGTGDLHFATITFDWNGDPYGIRFEPSNSEQRTGTLAVYQSNLLPDIDEAICGVWDTSQTKSGKDIETTDSVDSVDDGSAVESTTMDTSTPYNVIGIIVLLLIGVLLYFAISKLFKNRSRQTE